MKKIDTSVTHITPVDTNIFEDLGFNPREASKLKIKAQLMCQIIEMDKRETAEAGRSIFLTACYTSTSI